MNESPIRIADGFADKLFGDGEYNPFLDDEYWEEEEEP